jgi:hypothetical protein
MNWINQKIIKFNRLPPALHGDGAARRWRCSVSRRRHGAGAQETAGNGGSPARRRQRDAMATGERRARRSGRHDGGPSDDAVGEAVGAIAVRARPAVGRRVARARRSGAARRCREAGGASEAGCRDARRAVPTVALSHGVGAARGSHTATARCRAGPARCAASDKWVPLVSYFRIKNLTERK